LILIEWKSVKCLTTSKLCSRRSPRLACGAPYSKGGAGAGGRAAVVVIAILAVIAIVTIVAIVSIIASVSIV
jgi:hypothetical protein